MKMNKFMLAAAMTFATVSLAHAEDATPGAAAGSQGSGQLSFSGSIVDAPCSIKSESTRQESTWVLSLKLCWLRQTGTQRLRR